jgi:hypothetical protein
MNDQQTVGHFGSWPAQAADAQASFGLWLIAFLVALYIVSKFFR